MKKVVCFALTLSFLLACLPVLATQPQHITVTLMNCDTGRMITDGNNNQTFTLTFHADGSTLQDADGNYLDLQGTAPIMRTTPIYYSITETEMGRHQIQLPNGNYLYDSDEGTDNKATLANSDDNLSIRTGWFITESSDPTPLRILTIGDSLTYGINLDLSGEMPRVAYRKTLSENLIHYFGTVAFVGNVDEYITSLSDPFLYRHAGYSGYVIEDVYHVENHPGYKPMVDDMMKKYQPDIVIMMLGTNDLGRAMVNDIIPRWESFVLQVESQLPEDGLLLCSAIPPIESSTKEIMFNEKIQAKVHALANEGYKIGFADPFTPLNKEPSRYLNSDGVHYNSMGYNVIGEVFTEAITTAYTNRSEKVLPNPLIPTDPYAEPMEESSASTPDEGSQHSLSPMILILIGLGVAVIAAVIVLIVLLRKKK